MPRTLVLAAGVFLALSLAQTWPLVLHLNDRIPHDVGDPLLITYLLNWNAQVLPLTERWWSPPFFWPHAGMMTLSEHVLGLSLIASPLQRLGLPPVAAYNLLFLLSFWLSAVTGWLLAWTVTRSAAAAMIGGLAFAFAPYRASQLAHLQILMSAGIPLMFVALHHARRNGSWRWAALAAGCWVWQGLISAYYLLFLPVAAVLWVLWFARDDRRLWTRAALMFGAGAVLIAPLLKVYVNAHEVGLHARGIGELREYSADVASLGRPSPELAVWGRLSGEALPEQGTFPGLAVVLLAVIALLGRKTDAGPIRRSTQVFLALAAVFFALALVAALRPGDLSVGGLHVSLSRPHKPLAFAWLALLAAVASSRLITTAWASGSAVAGYALIAMATWILSLGPEPAADGVRFWYLAPYWFFYTYVPGFDAIRVPARLWMITAAALSVLAAAGAARLVSSGGSRRVVLVAMLGVVIVAEGWIGNLPLLVLPRAVVMPADAEVVWELPARDPLRETSAMYRSLHHRRPVINGYTGYRPEAYAALLKGIEDGRPETLAQAANGRSLAVIIDGASSSATQLIEAVREAGGICSADGELSVCLVRARMDR